MAKRLQDLTIIDNFMFGAVMSNEENCRLLLERILDIPIDHVVVTTEKTLVYHPNFKGIRLDVYAKDENNTLYNVEMQVEHTPIPKRSRYYHAQMGMEMIATGADYDQLPETYVIFICNYDPFGLKKYRYTFSTRCEESPDLLLNDGIHTIILNNRGQNPEDISPELLSFLNFTKATLEESEDKSDDPYVTQIQRYIRHIKHDRETEKQYMLLELMLKESEKKGVQMGVEKGRDEILTMHKDFLTTFLSKLGQVPPELTDKIQSLNDPEALQTLIFEAARVSSVDDFVKIFHQLT
ncbi:MAG: Rpn family recombination-promoting nuclease/putative transposase [Eubacteriales bacterium]|nr:Rpn family recombination-promoting nuclease/putative transposase [Eubacteriales bacterium]